MLYRVPLPAKGCKPLCLMTTAWLQVIKEKGLQKLPGRRPQDDVDDQEGALI